MSYSYKCYSDTKDFMKKFVNAEEGAIIYGITLIFTRRLQNRRSVKCRIMSNNVDRGRKLRPQSIAIREAGWLFCILSERR